MKPVRIVSGAVAALDRANVDTDQIIPKQFLKRVERSGFGEFLFWDWFRQPGFPLNRIEFHGAPILAAGRNFGSGSSREHAPLALAEAGVRCVIAEFYARIFFRNSINGGYLLPLESEQRLVERVRTGDELTVDLDNLLVRNNTKNEQYQLKPVGDVLPIIEAGGVFNYAKQAGMMK